MVSLNQMTDFQMVISDIENYKYTENEQKWVDEYIGPPLTENQIYDMNLRFHLHLTEDEKGEGFNKASKENKRNKSKGELPKSFSCLYDETTDLKKLWKTYCKLIWWKNLYHLPVEDKWWDYGEKLLKRGVKTRKTPLIDYVASVMGRRIIYEASLIKSTK